MVIPESATAEDEAPLVECAVKAVTSISAILRTSFKGTVLQAIQVLNLHPVKYDYDVIICCVLLHHATGELAVIF